MNFSQIESELKAEKKAHAATLEELQHMRSLQSTLKTEAENLQSALRTEAENLLQQCGALVHFAL